VTPEQYQSIIEGSFEAIQSELAAASAWVTARVGVPVTFEFERVRVYNNKWRPAYDGPHNYRVCVTAYNYTVGSFSSVNDAMDYALRVWRVREEADDERDERQAEMPLRTEAG